MVLARWEVGKSGLREVWGLAHVQEGYKRLSLDLNSDLQAGSAPDRTDGVHPPPRIPEPLRGEQRDGIDFSPSSP